MQVVAPQLASLMELRGDPRTGKFVENITFYGLTFSDTCWEPGPHDTMDDQAASNVPGGVMAVGARHIAIERCVLKNLGGYGIDLRDGCRGVRLAGNELAWISAGGIKVTGAVDSEPLRTGETIIEDNRLHHLGRRFHRGVGVLIMNSFGNAVMHNEISDLYYTGVSVGWVWGYGPSVSRDNRIEFNHIHHVGGGLLSDLGGVYTLGVSPGTVVRNNIVHHVEGHDKGWGLYTDEGSTGILLENNLVYRTSHGSFHQHYGRDNIVRNNIFALGRDAQIVRSRDEPHRSFTFERNIVYYGSGELFNSVWSGGTDHITLDQNLYWNAGGAAQVPGRQSRGLAGLGLRQALPSRRSPVPGCGPRRLPFEARQPRSRDRVPANRRFARRPAKASWLDRDGAATRISLAGRERPGTLNVPEHLP